MLSYQHGFHAGNHADVIKHLTWIGVINRLKIKEKPFTLFDTHSGAGCYDLLASDMQKNAEFETGVSLLSGVENTRSSLLNDYIQAVTSYFESSQYPGSPLISFDWSRDQDLIHLMELHPQEFEKLSHTAHRYFSERVKLHKRNGFEGIVGLTPPRPNRGAVLIDPPYERSEEYKDVVNTVRQILNRWSQAQIVVWYPLLTKRAGKKHGASERMCEQLGTIGGTCFTAELVIDTPNGDNGMYGSGVCVINPPWQLDELLNDAFSSLCNVLGTNANYNLNWLKAEETK